jgi:hypothetical protein
MKGAFFSTSNSIKNHSHFFGIVQQYPQTPSYFGNNQHMQTIPTPLIPFESRLINAHKAVDMRL